jgi:hypothetical protein
MKVCRASVVLLALTAAAFMADSVMARGHGGSGGGRSGHAGAGRSAHAGGHHHSHSRTRVFIGAGVVAPALWPWWDYPGYYVAGAYPAEPLYYIERGDPSAPVQERLYCPSANAYFPAVVDCAVGWERVAPPTQPLPSAPQ